MLCSGLSALSHCMSSTLILQGPGKPGSALLLKVPSPVCQECRNWQARREVDQQARLALTDLRARGLLSFRARNSQEEPTWAASERGRAVYECALPTRQGERLYEVRPPGRALCFTSQK